MSSPGPLRHTLSAALLALFLTGAATESFAQSAMESFRDGHGAKEKNEQKQADADTEAVVEIPEKYPQATRDEPSTKASRKLGPELKKIFDAYNAHDTATLVPLADAMIANEEANPYERAISARLVADSLASSDAARAQDYLRKVIEFNGLGNNEHYDSMLVLGQLQMQADQYAQGLATFDKLIAETATTDPNVLANRGNALYRLERYPEAAAAMQQAIAGAGDKANPQWLQMLMASYFDMGKPEQALAIAEGLLARNPDDKQMQLNMASIYMQADQDDKATALLEKMRAAGKLTEDQGYRNLYALYMNADGKEQQAIEVIKEGMDKGILKPDYQTWLALGQAYYFTDQIAPAIENYRKAAPLAPDGETYLNLARLLWGDGKLGEAKQAAQQALDKGIKQPQDAKKILAQKG